MNEWWITFFHQTKTYDAVTEKFMDFSFEKTHSAYMLFYERCDPNQKDLLSETPNVELNQELADWIWHDNIQFLHDKHVFDTTYFNFMWLICSNIPPSILESKEVMLSNVKLGNFFYLFFFNTRFGVGMDVWWGMMETMEISYLIAS